MTTEAIVQNNDNVVDLFTGKSLDALAGERIIRLSPEHDGLCMLYSNSHSSTDKLFSMQILCWGLQADGKTTALVPWLDRVISCQSLDDPCQGQWEGYYEPRTGEVFYQPPAHKVLELENAAHYFSHTSTAAVIQEIPDSIGTHAILNASDNLILTEVISWRLLNDGSIQGMLIDEEKVETTPVLAGDNSLYPANQNDRFRYFFQHHIANQLKAEDPEALAAIALLFNRP